MSEYSNVSVTGAHVPTVCAMFCTREKGISGQTTRQLSSPLQCKPAGQLGALIEPPNLDPPLFSLYLMHLEGSPRP